MTNKTSTKRALLTSALAVLLCLSMLIGTTFAWFTDSVTSSGNKIVAGTLKIDLEVLDKTTGAWNSVKESKDPIFSYDLWEPGYTEVKVLKVQNEGSLALKWKATLVSDAKLTELADVIDVYVKPGVTAYPTDRELADWDKVGTLAEFINTIETTTVGTLEAEAEATLGIAFKMQESAGNEYQGMSLGGEFDICILATQYTFEKDSFDNKYDENADFDGEISTVEALKSALAAGGTYKLTQNITVDETMTIPAGVSVDLEMGTNTIVGDNAKGNGAVIANEGTLTIVGGTVQNTTTNGDAVISNSGTMVLDGVEVVGAPMGSTGYPAYAVSTSGKLTVEDGTVISVDRGAISMSNGADVTINGGSFVVSDAADGRNMTLHTVYAYGYDSTLTINGGYFEQGHTSTGGASVICPAGATINIYDGDFRDAMDDTNWKSTGNFQNYMGYGAPVNVYGGTYDDNTVLKNLAEGYTTVKNSDDTYTVLKGVKAADNAALVEAIKDGNKTVVLSAGTYEFPSIPAGTTIVGQDGVVFEDTLSGTLDNVTLKNIHIKAGNAQRWAYSEGDLLFENCTFEATSVYAIHYDGLNGANITYKDCTIIGWAAIGGGAEHITFDGCKIYGNGTYGVLRLYSPATIKNCVFDVSAVNTADVYQDGIHAVDCEIKVSNNTNVNGDMSDIYNISGTGVITEA